MPVKIITQKRVKEALQYSPETGVFKWKIQTSVRISVGDDAGTKTRTGYIHIKLDGYIYAAHRLIWMYMYGFFPKNIDHIDHDRSNNRLPNLRDVTHIENMSNQKIRSTNTSGIMGVRWDENRNKWHTRIRAQGKNFHLGRFQDFFLACCARKSAELKYGFHPNHGS
jgi:hypothetical protein